MDNYGKTGDWFLFSAYAHSTHELYFIKFMSNEVIMKEISIKETHRLSYKEFTDKRLVLFNISREEE